jgi:hypothetical protein
MSQKRQGGWLKIERRSQGETWVVFFRTTRKFDGKRVENKISIGLVRDFPDKQRHGAEVERLQLQTNPVDPRRGLTFADLAHHYAEHELADSTESIYERHTPLCGLMKESCGTACCRDGAIELPSA